VHPLLWQPDAKIDWKNSGKKSTLQGMSASLSSVMSQIASRSVSCFMAALMSLSMSLFSLKVGELVERTEATLGPVDILVNNAGIMYYTMMKNLKEEEWERQIDLNCKV
jgi:NADP-dependent 3-hydroxy acid dehydrogenase YdfG